MKTAYLSLAPGAAAGVFVGRVLSELWAPVANGTHGVTALTLTLLTTLAGAYLTRRIPFERSWPALLLLLYVVLPERNLEAATAVGLLTLFLFWRLSAASGNGRAAGSRGRMGLVVVIAAFAALYILTLAPDILPADNGEFQVVAAELGVAHPPGFALYTLAAHLMTRLPLGPSAAYRVNLLSAITSALTLAVIYQTVLLLTNRHLAAATAVLALGTATTFWAQATTANIRSLSALFAALMLLTLLYFYRAVQQTDGIADDRRRDRFVILYALVLGLSVTHHASLAFIGLIGTMFVVFVDPLFLKNPRRWWRPGLAFLLGLLPLLYFPLRAGSGARGSSADLATLPGFLEHVLALGFRGDLFAYLEPALLWERSKIMGNVLTFQFEILLLLGMIVGLAVLLRRDWRLAFLTGGSFGLMALITATYRAPQTVEYMLPAYVPLALLLGAAVGGPAGGWRDLQVRRLSLPLGEIFAGLLLLAAGRQLLANYASFQWLHGDTTARDYAQGLLEAAPTDSVLLADWHWVTPLWYLQEVEGQGEDIEVRFVFPEGESYGETWARRIADALANGDAVISTHYEPGAFAALPAPEPLGEALLFRQEPRRDLPIGYDPLDARLGEQIDLLGYGLATPAVQAGQEAVLNLAWQPGESEADGVTLFLHLVGEDGTIYAQQDVMAQPQPEGITLTQFRLTPRLDARPGSYSVLAGAYGEQPLLSDDGLERTPLTGLSLQAKEQPQATLHPLRRTIVGEDSQELIGYDWDNTLGERPRLYLHWRTAEGYQTEVRDEGSGTLPPFVGPWGVPSERWSRVLTPGAGYYVPFGQGIIWHGDPLAVGAGVAAGQSLTVEQDLLSGQPVMRDYAISVRLIGFEEDGHHWAWWDLDDGIPAMGAIPTLKWIAGSTVRSPHFVQVDDDAPLGQTVGGALNLYDAFTSRVLPVLDERITGDFAWVPLGETAVTLE